MVSSFLLCHSTVDGPILGVETNCSPAITTTNVKATALAVSSQVSNPPTIPRSVSKTPTPSYTTSRRATARYPWTPAPAAANLNSAPPPTRVPAKKTSSRRSEAVSAVRACSSPSSSPSASPPARAIGFGGTGTANSGAFGWAKAAASAWVFSTRVAPGSHTPSPRLALWWLSCRPFRCWLRACGGVWRRASGAAGSVTRPGARSREVEGIMLLSIRTRMSCWGMMTTRRFRSSA